MIALDERMGREAVLRWFRAALRAVDPESAVRRHLACEGRRIVVDGRELAVVGRLFIAAFGKAAPAMARGAAVVCEPLIERGIVITKDGHLSGELPERFVGFEAAHPIPDARGVAATERLLDVMRSLEEGDVVLTLISGGGSALLESPLGAVSMQDIARTTDWLLRAGAPIQDLNAVRVPLSRVKGGDLRRAGANARFVTLLLSDVIGDDPNVIASGPTVPSDFTGPGALAVLERYGVLDQVPERVRTALEGATVADDRELFAGDIVAIVAGNRTALEAFAAEAEGDGARVSIIDEPATGEARSVALDLAASCLEAAPDIDLIARGGETTVRVLGDGDGGRNTELALAAALELEQRGENGWLVGSLATDGQDAQTGAAGAVASVATLARARAAGVDPHRALARNDSLAVFRAGGGLIETGPTGTNVNDLIFAVRIVPEA